MTGNPASEPAPDRASPIPAPAPGRIGFIRPRGPMAALGGILAIALAAGPLFWLAVDGQTFLLEGHRASRVIGDDWLHLLAIALILGLAFSLPAAILNAVLQAWWVRRGMTHGLGAVLAGMMGGLGALLLSALSLAAFYDYPLRYFIHHPDDALMLAFPYFLVAGLLGALYRRLAFRRLNATIPL